MAKSCPSNRPKSGGGRWTADGGRQAGRTAAGGRKAGRTAAGGETARDDNWDAAAEPAGRGSERIVRHSEQSPCGGWCRKKGQPRKRAKSRPPKSPAGQAASPEGLEFRTVRVDDPKLVEELRRRTTSTIAARGRGVLSNFLALWVLPIAIFAADMAVPVAANHVGRPGGDEHRQEQGPAGRR